MSKKKKEPVRKAEKPKAPNNEARELKLANQLSGKMHGGMSRIRLSLTFRIAMHYCIQLLRSFIPAAVVLSLLFIIGLSVPIGRRIENMDKTLISDEVSEVEYGIISLSKTETQAENGFFPRFGQQIRTVFSGGLSQELLRFYYSSGLHGELLATVQIHSFVILYGFMLLGLFLTDFFRMIYFFRHEKRLNKRVLAPIRDIADMAATLSENNLSNRINIAGTKNELKDLASVINTMLDRIERSYNSQKQFVSDASHELRTPIAVIRGYTDMLKRWGKDDPEVLDEGISAISMETDSMKDLVESLLFLARHDKKTLMMEKSDFSAGDLLREVHKEEEMVHTDHQFDMKLNQEMILHADRNMIKQVLRIFIDNAVKYSPAGSLITIGCTRGNEGQCELSVSDQGAGISGEDISKIFERFYRSESARKSESSGHGLGLSIARIIVVAHGGQIRVRSKEGQGTTFTVSLPVQKEITSHND